MSGFLDALGLSAKSEGDDDWPPLPVPPWREVLQRPSLRPPLLSAARSGLPHWNVGQMEDVVQSVLEAQLLSEFPGGCPRAYLRVITRRAAIKTISKEIPSEIYEGLTRDVAAVVAAEGLRDAFVNALSTLPEIGREWLRRIYLEGEKRDNLRKTFGLSAWEARTFDANILLNLRDALADQGWSWDDLIGSVLGQGEEAMT